MSDNFSGKARKRLPISVPFERLHIDTLNPRLPEGIQGKSEREIIYHMHRFFDLRELAQSMSQHGYFDEEPMVVVPKNLPKEFRGKSHLKLKSDKKYNSFIKGDKTEFIVIEGNRRLSTIKMLLSEKLRSDFKVREWPNISKEIKEDLMVLPLIVYPERNEVLPYMGVRHITGVKKWESYAKARYIASLVEGGGEIEDLQKTLADIAGSVRKMLIAYRLLEQIEGEAPESASRAKQLFSYLILAIGQNAVKEYIGMGESLSKIDLKTPVPRKKIKGLTNLFSWLFGEGKEILPVIRESRDITGKLSPVLRNRYATEHLIATRDLDEAYERSGGEEELLMSQLKRVNSLLQKILGIVFRYKKKDAILKEIEKCDSTLKQIIKDAKG